MAHISTEYFDNLVGGDYDVDNDDFDGDDDNDDDDYDNDYDDDYILKHQPLEML